LQPSHECQTEHSNYPAIAPRKKNGWRAPIVIPKLARVLPTKECRVSGKDVIPRPVLIEEGHDELNVRLSAEINANPRVHGDLGCY
jgi:hypothetical protein